MRSIKRAFLFSLGLGCGVAVAFFMAANTATIDVVLWPDRTYVTAIWVVALVSFAAGAITPVLLALASGLENIFGRRRLHKRIRELEEELVELRNLPLTEARIDLERPAPSIRPMVEEPREVEAELIMPTGDGDVREADLYPSVVDSRER